jgi:hypothetical protein
MVKFKLFLFHSFFLYLLKLLIGEIPTKSELKSWMEPAMRQLKYVMEHNDNSNNNNNNIHNSMIDDMKHVPHDMVNLLLETISINEIREIFNIDKSVTSGNTSKKSNINVNPLQSTNDFNNTMEISDVNISSSLLSLHDTVDVNMEVEASQATEEGFDPSVIEPLVLESRQPDSCEQSPHIVFIDEYINKESNTTIPSSNKIFKIPSVLPPPPTKPIIQDLRSLMIKKIKGILNVETSSDSEKKNNLVKYYEENLFNSSISNPKFLNKDKIYERYQEFYLNKPKLILKLMEIMLKDFLNKMNQPKENISSDYNDFISKLFKYQSYRYTSGAALPQPWHDIDNLIHRITVMYVAIGINLTIFYISMCLTTLIILSVSMGASIVILFY